MSNTVRIIAMYIPLLTGSLSMMGSSSIIYSIWAQRVTKMRDPQHRILLGMSIFDIFYSLCKALTFALYPKGLGVPAFGNLWTCSMQGFFTQFGYAAGSYNLVLSLYYYLTICRGMKQKEFGRCLEKCLHSAVIVLHVGFAITGAAIGLFNPTPAFCYIAPHPLGCAGNPDVPCERFGTTYPIFYEVFGQMWIQLAYVVIIVANVAIWWHVRTQERAILKYSPSVTKSVLGEMRTKTKHARSVFIQSMLYVGAFVLSWSWATVFHLIGWVGGYQAVWPVLLINTFLPLQGFWNAFIYARPRYLRIKARGAKLTALQTLKLVFLPPTKESHASTLHPSASSTGSAGDRRLNRVEGAGDEGVSRVVKNASDLDAFAENDFNDDLEISYKKSSKTIQWGHEQISNHTPVPLGSISSHNPVPLGSSHTDGGDSIR